MKKKLLTISAFSAALLLPASLQAQIVYEGTEGAGKGKHLVFIASDHEYRAEQTCPALARILAQHHGFKCTVLFGVDDQGFIQAGASNIKGLEALKEADGMVMFTRFLDLPDDQMQHIVDYLDKGGPLVGFRTSSHAFKIAAGKKFSKYSFRAKDEGFVGGFGQKYLGNTWEGHYGKNHVQGTRIQIIPEKKDHVILKGVKDNAFCHAGGYNGVQRDGMVALTKTQPLLNMEVDGPVDPKKKPVISTWTFSYKGKDGKDNRVFHSTQGASEDLLDDSYRRMVVNGIFWSVGLEGAIKADNKIDFVGPFNPTLFKFNGHVKQQKPTDMAGFDTPVGAKEPADRTRGKKK